MEGNVDLNTVFDSIKYNIGKASLEDVKSILDHYDQETVVIDDQHSFTRPNPMQGASLNARYKELTGEDHPTFLKAQEQILDEYINDPEAIHVDGKPTIYERLKNNLTGEGPGIDILESKEGSYIDKFERIKFDMSKASLEDVKDILDHYDQDSALISGVETYSRPNPMQGASLNARYKELTGEDHPMFLKTQEKLLDEFTKDRNEIHVDGKTSIYDELRNNTMEIGNHDHILYRSSDVLLNPEKASLEDVSSMLDYYNGKPVLIDGIARQPFNDPETAAKLNARYKELTGEDHPTYIEQNPKVIEQYKEINEQLAKSQSNNSPEFGRLAVEKPRVKQIRELREMRQQLIDQKINTPLSEIDDPKYIEYRDKVNETLEQSQNGEFIKSEFTRYINPEGQERCTHTLSSSDESQSMQTLMSNDFEYNEQFKTGMLEPSVVDFAKRCPVEEINVTNNLATPQQAPTPQQTSNVEVVANNAMMQINNVEPQVAAQVAQQAPQIEPSVAMAQQAQVTAAGPVMTMGSGMGFASRLLISIFTGILIGIIILYLTLYK